MTRPIEYDAAVIWAMIAFYMGILIGMISPFRIVVS